MNLEPIFITFIGNGIPDWSHPEILKIAERNLKQYSEACPENYMGNLLRVNVKLGDNTFIIVVIVYEGFDEIMASFGSEADDGICYEVFEYIRIFLGEDVWSPGGEQYYFSEHGQKLNDFIDIWSDDYGWNISPDLSIFIEDGVINHFDT